MADDDPKAARRSYGVFDRFSDRARHAMSAARKEAERYKHDFIGTEHLLLGVLTVAGGAAEVLEKAGGDIEKIRTSLIAEIRPGKETVLGQIPFTPRAKKVLECAISEAQTMQSEYVGTEHLLLGLHFDTEATSGKVLAGLNRSADELRSLAKSFQAEHRETIQPDGNRAELDQLERETTMEILPSDNPLSPSQSATFKQLHQTMGTGSIFVLWGNRGLGLTTIMRASLERTGGAFLNIGDFLILMRNRHPLALEETLEQMVAEALGANTHVYLDDLMLINVVVTGCNSYPRSGYLTAVMERLALYAVENRKKLIIANAGSDSGAIHKRAAFVKLSAFTPEDYAYFCNKVLKPESAGRLDYKKIHRFAPKLNAWQIIKSCEWLRVNRAAVGTEEMIDYLRSQSMTSNVDLGEVRAVELSELKGVDEVIRALEANIIIPLENDKLAEELNLKPKRGVLLAGPPGTGKTTVGRALAHRLKSKFFLIDGTFIAGTSQFYGRIHQVFENAKSNAPSIIFIDDSDVIFENGEEAGLYRYLLTMLDGLESESAGRVCVMLTAMDVGNLPPALIRSGRIELWLEMSLPDAAARGAILTQLVVKFPAVMGGVDIARSAAATEGFTGADLTRLVEDTKTLYAYDRAKGVELKSTTDYLLSAVNVVRSNTRLYEEAEKRARQRRPVRPPWFDASGGGAYTPDDDE